jgi:hypothetical protein
MNVSVVRLAVYCLLELPLCGLLIIIEQLGESPVVHRLGCLLVEGVAHLVSRVLDHEAVRAPLAQTIAAGVHCFLQNEQDLEAHVRSMAACVSKTQPDLARQQGQDFPLIVGSFLQGILHGVSSNKQNRHEAASAAATAVSNPRQEESEDAQSQPSELPPSLSVRSNDTVSTSHSPPPPKAVSAVNAVNAPHPLSKRLQFPRFGGGGQGGGVAESAEPMTSAACLEPTREDGTLSSLSLSPPRHPTGSILRENHCLGPVSSCHQDSGAATSGGGSSDHKKSV